MIISDGINKTEKYDETQEYFLAAEQCFGGCMKKVF